MSLELFGELRQGANVSARSGQFSDPEDAISEAIELRDRHSLKSVTVIFRPGAVEVKVEPDDDHRTALKRLEDYRRQHG